MVLTSRLQSYENPRRWSCRRKVATLRSVVVRGWMPSRIAACSAGSPNASQPIGWSTLKPRIRLVRATMSVAV